MKKLLAMLCAISLALTCAAMSMAEETALEPVEMNVWVTGTVDQKDSELVWEAYNEKLQETLPNTKVNFYVPTDYGTAFNMAMASGERIDLAWSGYSTKLVNDAKNGTLLPLDELVREYGQGVIDTLTIEIINQHRLMDGKLYQIPSYQGLSGMTYSVFPMEIVDLMREGWVDDYQENLYAGFEASTDEEKLRVTEVSIALADEFVVAAYENGKLGTFASPNDIASRLFPSGSIAIFDNVPYVVMKGEDSFEVCNKFDPEGLQYKLMKLKYAKIAEWYEKGYIPADTISLAANKGYVRWKGALADDTTCFCSSGNAEVVAKATESDVVSFYARNVFYSELGNATGMSIPYTSTCPERAMMLINEMYVNSDLYELWVYGIEDVHYEEKEDGSIVTFGGDGQATSDWAYGQWKWTFGNCMLSRQTQTDPTDPVDVLRADMERLPNSYVRPFLSWSFDQTAVQAEYANVKVIWDEAQQQLNAGILGANWEAVFDAYVEEINAAGMDKIVAEVQRQVDEYVAAQGLTSFNLEHARTELVREKYEIVRYADLAK